jgi:hypothetical protein
LCKARKTQTIRSPAPKRKRAKKPAPDATEEQKKKYEEDEKRFKEEFEEEKKIPVEPSVSMFADNHVLKFDVERYNRKIKQLILKMSTIQKKERKVAAAATEAPSAPPSTT